MRSAESALADFEQLAPGPLPAHVFIIYGEEAYYQHRLVRCLRRLTLTPDFEAFNSSFFEHEGATPGTVRAAVLTPPVLADYRLVVVRDPSGLVNGRRAASGPAGEGAGEGAGDDGDEEDDPGRGEERPPEGHGDEGGGPDAAREWAALLGDVPAETRLVLTISRELTPTGPLLKGAASIQPPADVIRCFPATARSAETWVRKIVTEAGGRVDPDASQALVSRSGTCLLTLEKEIEKLITYAGESGRITSADVLLAATPSAEASVFELVDHIGSRRPLEAVRALRRLVEQGEPPLRLMAMVVRQVRLIFITREMIESGRKVKEVEERLKLPTWVVKNYLTQARNFDREKLCRMMRALHRVDLDIKTGRQEPVTALELFILGHGVHGAN